jgi:hypothetical protein
MRPVVPQISCFLTPTPTKKLEKAWQKWLLSTLSPFSGTLRTAVTSVSAPNGSLPLMSVIAKPPNFLIRPASDIDGSQALIFSWMPLSRESWIDSLQIIISHKNLMT